ncbi:hypothetical protein HanPSC8_Chr13g0588821 [Helianthus annuus]|nr:hypothetical protein HanPSC8_Chr13g0588821 [Helianthus annuus]
MTLHQLHTIITNDCSRHHFHLNHPHFFTQTRPRASMKRRELVRRFMLNSNPIHAF